MAIQYNLYASRIICE